MWPAIGTDENRRGADRRIGAPAGPEDLHFLPYMHPQQTGVLFIIMQHMQPAFIMVAMQSQQA